MTLRRYKAIKYFFFSPEDRIGHLIGHEDKLYDNNQVLLLL